MLSVVFFLLVLLKLKEVCCDLGRKENILSAWPMSLKTHTHMHTHVLFFFLRRACGDNWFEKNWKKQSARPPPSIHCY